MKYSEILKVLDTRVEPKFHKVESVHADITIWDGNIIPIDMAFGLIEDEEEIFSKEITVDGTKYWDVTGLDVEHDTSTDYVRRWMAEKIGKKIDYMKDPNIGITNIFRVVKFGFLPAGKIVLEIGGVCTINGLTYFVYTVIEGKDSENYDPDAEED
tara:strand:+ start:179 stop:646 length:468 start_codon:yes stop_codon:yes gene_type:complete